MRTLIALLLLATGAQAGSEYPVGFQIRISSDVAGKYAGADSQDLVVDSRALFIGDSITFSNPHLKAARNAGVSGETTEMIGRRFGREISNGKPAYVHIHAGANDFTSKTAPDTSKMIATVDTMVSEARARRIPVILGTVLPMDLNYSPSAALIPAYNAMLVSKFSKRTVIADYYSAMVLSDGTQNKALFKDPVHPNEAGYAVMNKVLDGAVAEMQRRRAERKAKWQNATPEQRAAWREKRKSR